MTFRRILIVDDEMHWLASALDDAEQALNVEFIRVRHPNQLPEVSALSDTICAFLDYRMPVMTGAEVARKLRAEGYTKPLYDIGSFATSGTWPPGVIRVGKSLSIRVLKLVLRHVQGEITEEQLRDNLRVY